MELDSPLAGMYPEMPRQIGLSSKRLVAVIVTTYEWSFVGIVTWTHEIVVIYQLFIVIGFRFAIKLRGNDGAKDVRGNWCEG